MEKKIEEMLSQMQDLETQLANPNLAKHRQKYKEVAREHSHLAELRSLYGRYTRVKDETEQTRALVAEEGDAEMREMAREELKELKTRQQKLEEDLRLFLAPRDPLDQKNIIMEIRAGTGGSEAALFAADLFRMYSRYAETQKWRVEIMNINESDLGGFKEIVYSITGKNVYENLRYESGAHRVQRIPVTESGGRIHTSAVTVAVLPEAEDTDIEIRTEDLRVDVYRSSGPGGQSVNTTDSAVRITHLPTGLVVTCQDEKSQIKNRAKAMRVLRARLYEAEEEKKHRERAQSRKSQIGSGDRSERIRTYNFPQNRLTDHRINLTLYKLDQVMAGEMGEAVNALKMEAKSSALANL